MTGRIPLLLLTATIGWGVTVSEQKEFTVVGIAVRTTNAREMTADGIIPKQWQKVMSEGLISKIPNRVDNDLLAVYCDYASDKDGEYTYLIGARVKAGTQAPEGMVARTVPAGKYAMFTTEKGPVAKVVTGAWMRIWALGKSEPGGDRAYKADFEVYDEHGADPANVQVDIYVGMK
jgi:predicted transcriptional regulator YdeE